MKYIVNWLTKELNADKQNFSKSTKSVYFTKYGLKIRVSDHLSFNSNVMQIVVIKDIVADDKHYIFIEPDSPNAVHVKDVKTLKIMIKTVLFHYKNIYDTQSILLNKVAETNIVNNISETQNILAPKVNTEYLDMLKVPTKNTGKLHKKLEDYYKLGDVWNLDDSKRGEIYNTLGCALSEDTKIYKYATQGQKKVIRMLVDNNIPYENIINVLVRTGTIKKNKMKPCATELKKIFERFIKLYNINIIKYPDEPDFFDSIVTASESVTEDNIKEVVNE